MKSELNLGTAFESENYRTELSRAVTETLTELEKNVKEPMETNQPTGVIYSRKGVIGGLHQASAIGEPPAPETRHLLDSTTAFQTDELSGKLEIAVPYANTLQNDLNRPIITNEILDETGKTFFDECDKAVKSVI